MMFRLMICSILSGIMVLAILSEPVAADELTLKNGDRLTGAIVKMAGKKITIKTSYGGDIVINRGEVSGLMTSGPMVFKMVGGKVIEGSAYPAEEGNVSIKPSKIGEVEVYSLDDIDAIRQLGEDPNNYLKGRVNGSASISDGNTDTKNYHLETEVIRRIDRNRWTVGASYNAASDQGSRTEENYEGHLKQDFFLSGKWYLYANLNAAKDRFKDLKLRTFVGLGAGHQFWESSERNLALEAGLGYTDEDYALAPDDSYPSARWAANYDQQLFETAARFFHKHELLVGLEDIKDLLFKARTGVTIPLYKNLSASVQVNYEWDNTPAENTERSDTLYLMGLDYNW